MFQVCSLSKIKIMIIQTSSGTNMKKGNRISAEGIKALGKMLKINTTLSTLRFSGLKKKRNKRMKSKTNKVGPGEYRQQI